MVREACFNEKKLALTKFQPIILAKECKSRDKNLQNPLFGGTLSDFLSNFLRKIFFKLHAIESNQALSLRKLKKKSRIKGEIKKERLRKFYE